MSHLEAEFQRLRQRLTDDDRDDSREPTRPGVRGSGNGGRASL